MRFVTAAAAAALLAACSQPAANEEAADAAAPAMDAAEQAPAADQSGADADMIERAIGDASRPEEDRARDIDRHPAEILSLAGVEAGWRVADIGAGTGYYSRILSAAVGEDGHVFAFNPNWVAERFTATDEGLAALAETRANMTHLNGEAAGFTDQIDGPLDAVFIVLFYHDTAWDSDFRDPDDRAAMNQGIFDALRPGGVYLVIDHHAAEDAGLADIGDTHRINAAIVREEVLAAGFELVEDSDILANPDDPRDISVFDPSIRGETDRFIYLFRKPE